MSKIFLAALSLDLLVPAALAQMPDKFTNLQVFPKDITKQELMATTLCS